MSNKLIKSTPEQRQKQEDEAYMKGKPTRMEVANYVNSLFEQHVIPSLHQDINQVSASLGLGLMVIQAILIEKGICTGEEIEQITKTFLEKQNSESEENPTEKSE